VLQNYSTEKMVRMKKQVVQILWWLSNRGDHKKFPWLCKIQQTKTKIITLRCEATRTSSPSVLQLLSMHLKNEKQFLAIIIYKKNDFLLLNFNYFFYNII